MHPTRDVHFVWLRTDGKVEFSTSIYDAGWSIVNIMEIHVQVNCKADNRKLRKLVLTKLDGAVFKVTGIQHRKATWRPAWASPGIGATLPVCLCNTHVTHLLMQTNLGITGCWCYATLRAA
jgi:hypothetical protein